METLQWNIRGLQANREELNILLSGHTIRSVTTVGYADCAVTQACCSVHWNMRTSCLLLTSASAAHENTKFDKKPFVRACATDVTVSCWCVTGIPRVTSSEVLTDLRSATDTTSAVVKFNISRSRVRKGARRAFLRHNYGATKAMCVKFMDDIGMSEGAVDQGGPLREFLQQLMDYLAEDSPVFIGASGAKHLFNTLHSGNWRCFHYIQVCVERRFAAVN